jgi:chromosome segregation ATPase
LESQLAEIQAQRDERLSGIEAGIADLTNRLAERTDALQEVRREQAALVSEITREVEAEQPPALPPKLTFAARSKALSALRNSPAEAGVPHLETVEGFAQAALGILFFALLALKLFEPPAVHAYFSEAVQLAYRKYLDGGLAHIPGFDRHQDAVRRLAPLDFARLWEQWRRDPNSFATRQQRIQSAESRLRRMSADIDYESELLERRRDDIDARLVLERRRQEAELRALEQQLDLELAENKRRLSEETDTELEELAQRREEARKAHELTLAELEQRFSMARARLDDELDQRRATWKREQAEAEAELEQRKQAVESAERREREQVRLKQLVLDDRRRLRERTLEQRSAAERAEREAADRELRMRETRALLEQEREAEARLREQFGDLLARRAAHVDRAAALAAELEQGMLRQSELGGRARELRTAIEDRAPAGAGGLPFGGGEEARRGRRAEKELKQLERDMEQLQLRRGRLAAERAGAEQAARELEGAVDALKLDIDKAGGRVARYRDTLDRLLLSRG